MTVRVSESKRLLTLRQQTLDSEEARPIEAWFFAISI